VKLFSNLHKVNRLFIRFIVIGIINTIFGYSVFSVFIFLELHYSLASLLSTVAGIIFNFKSIGSYVFKNKNNSLFLKFVLVYVIVYLINLLLLKILSTLGLNYYLSGALVLLPLAIISFVLNKNIVYRVGK
jgi:putative flippase GtrA